MILETPKMESNCNGKSLTTVSQLLHLKCLRGSWLSLVLLFLYKRTSQPVFTCSKLALETLEQGMKYVQS